MEEKSYSIETEEQLDGRWIAEIINVPGVNMAYGPTEAEAITNVEVLALRALADQIERSKITAARVSFFVVRASIENTAISSVTRT